MASINKKQQSLEQAAACASAPGHTAFVSTKLAPPSQATPWIDRSGLLEPLLRAEQSKIIVVTAPAGYGKTVLISQLYHVLAEQGRAVGWLSVDQNDTDPAAMLGCLVLAICQGLPGTACFVSASQRCSFEPSAEAGLANAIAAVAALEHRFVLFIDDFDLCEEPAAVSVLSTFISRAPANLTFVIAGREPPCLSLRRLAAEGRVEVVNWHSLLFNTAEAAELFASNNIALSADQIDHLLDVTEGWPMGLQLARLTLDQNDNPDEVIANFSGRFRSVSDYLAEDVLALKDQPTIDFLLQTSVLERFSAELCNNLLGISDAEHIIEGLARSNTFVFSLDAEGKWYRYHHLFQAFLRKRLDARDAVRLQKSASKWLQENEEYQDAVRLAAATKDNDFIARTLTEVCKGLAQTGQDRLLRSVVSRLPFETLTRYPRLALYTVWSDDMLGNLQEAQHLLDVIEHAYGENAELAEEYPSRTRLEDDILHKRMMLALSQGEITLVLEICEKLLANKSFCDPYFLASVYAAQISARYHMFDCSGIAGSAERIIRQLPERGVKNGSIWTNCIIGLAHERRGETAVAKESYARALDLSESMGHSPHLADMAASFLANVEYEENNIARARELLRKFVHGSPAGGIIDSPSSGIIVRSRVHALEGAHDKAARVLDNAIELFVGRQLCRVHNVLVAERIKQSLTSGRLDEIAPLAARVEITLASSPPRPSASSTTWDMTGAVIWSQVAISAGEYRKAAALLQAWISYCQKRDCERPALMMSLLLARTQTLDGDVAGSVKRLKSVIVTAQKMGLVRTLVDEGAWLHGMMRGLFDDPVALQDEQRDYVKTLIGLFPEGGRTLGKKPSDLIVTPLSRRETEILGLVSKGLKGRYIAAQLGITEGTVKWYLQQIFDKLDVRTRDGAVARAREIGVIP